MTRRIPLHDMTSDTSVVQHASADADSQSMYAKRRHIYIREIYGVFQSLRRKFNWLLMTLYFGLPWVSWEGRPLIWFDLPSREFHLFTGTFYPQDFILLAWILIICAFGLFLITVFAGRVWCGYSCPQSVWTFLFTWFEHRLEGPRHRRIRRDQAPSCFDTLWRKTAKHGAWLAIAFATGLAFVGYFTPIRQLVIDLITLNANPWAYFWIGFFTLFTYLNAGWLREQVCLHMCPYARFQSAMFDSDTLIVSYDVARGEPRGRRNDRLADQAMMSQGDCIDCELCVQVCPTGIDIRNGLQYECIGCAACIDACDSVMERIGKPAGLVRYTTERALAGKPSRILRPQLIGYAAVLLAMVGLLVIFLASRVPLEFEVTRERQQLFVQTGDGYITNYYNLNIRNQDDRQHRYRLVVSGLPGLVLVGPDRLEVAARNSRNWRIALRAEGDALTEASHPVMLRIESLDDGAIASERETRFWGPTKRHASDG